MLIRVVGFQTLNFQYCQRPWALKFQLQIALPAPRKPWPARIGISPRKENENAQLCTQKSQFQVVNPAHWMGSRGLFEWLCSVECYPTFLSVFHTIIGQSMSVLGTKAPFYRILSQQNLPKTDEPRCNFKSFLLESIEIYSWCF